MKPKHFQKIITNNTGKTSERAKAINADCLAHCIPVKYPVKVIFAAAKINIGQIIPTIVVARFVMSVSPSVKKILTISFVQYKRTSVAKEAINKLMTSPIFKNAEIRDDFFAPKLTLIKGEIPSPTP